MALILVLCGAAGVQAVPFQSPTVDGVIQGDGLDWDPADRVVADTGDDVGPAENIRHLWLTWDADNLYVGIDYEDFATNLGLRIYMDLGRGVGPRSAAELDTFGGQFLFPVDGTIDLVLGRPMALGPGTDAPQTMLITDASGAFSSLDGAVTAVQTQQFGASKANEKFIVHNTAEIALPWDALYPGGGGSVPANTVIRAVALIGRGFDNNGLDSAPDNDGLDGGAATVELVNQHASVIDADGDGQVDAADATISGTVTLPGDPGTGTVTVTAELIGFAGRDPGALISSTTTADGVRTWTLPRLAAGTYRLTTTAEGYFDDVTEVTVGQSAAVTGVDRTLDKATAIAGTISFDTADSQPGTLTLTDDTGAVLGTRAFTAAGGPYVFYVESSGDYTVRASAANHFDFAETISVTEGQDATLDILLRLQTVISGTVILDGTEAAVGLVKLTDAQGVQLAVQGLAGSGSTFRFYVPEDGEYTVTATTQPAVYVAQSTTVTVVGGADVTGLVITMPLAALVSGSIAFEGPAASGRWDLYDTTSGARRDSASFDTAGAPFDFYLEPGTFRLEIQAAGYVEREVVFDVGTVDMSLGALELTAVRATHLEIVDESGATLPAVLATYYDPANGDPWTANPVLLAARDDEGRDDLYDLDGELSGFVLTALKVDDSSQPHGTPVFYGTANENDVTTTVSFADGRARFWMSNTAVEVLRVYLNQPGKAPQPGRIIVAFRDPQPTTVLLTAERDTLTADGIDAITVAAQMYDSAGNESLLSEVPMTFSIVPASSGSGQVQGATAISNVGRAEAAVIATGAGTISVTVSVVIDNRALDVVAGSLGSGLTTLDLTSVAGATAGWDLSLPSNLSDLSTPVSVQVQLIDAFGNPTAEPGRNAAFAVSPAGFGSFSPTVATTDADGRASASFVPSGTAGLATISVSGDGLAGDEAGLKLRDVAVVPDAVWFDEPDEHNTFDTTDLTALVLDNTPDELLLEIPFSSNWNGLQLHVIFEVDNDPEGFIATGGAEDLYDDPFEQPVNYGHADRPDYALTLKYSANDYGDFRKWNKTSGNWEFWDLENEVYGDPVTDQNVLARWMTKLEDRVEVRIPFTVFGGAPTSLRTELYLTQDDGEKRAAFDSAPQDATLDLDFDYDNPEDGDWDVALGPTTLSAWGPAYTVKTVFPSVPTISDTTASPSAPTAGDVLVLSARVADGGDGVGDVLADLSAMGGSSLVRLYDDGDAAHGDAVAGDGQYSLRTMVPPGNPGGLQDLVISAFDGSNALAATATVTIDVTAIVEPILQASDPVGDDHGPNQSGTARKFITYPTNIAFVEGAFDLTGLTIFETEASVGGTPVEMIAFQVSLVDFPDPDDPGTADWNPLYGELNIEKIDILIDNAPGGATASLPNRQAAFLPHDAWDYAVIMDGWYKAVIPSRGQNTLDSWRENALRTDRDIQIIGDPAANTVTALVSKAALGDPTPDDIAKWDIAVLVSSHDFGGEEVLGGIRWVNESRSEWNFGGGDNSDRDANIVDLLLIPGEGHEPGQTQEELLDYDSPTALARLDEGLTAVALEMSAFEDTGAPVIDTGGKGSVVTTIDPLADAPVVVAVRITDDNRVAGATFRYRKTDTPARQWDEELPMGFLGNDLWVVDILPAFLESLVVSPVDGTRYLEFEVEARDALDKTAISPVTTLQINPVAECRPADATLDTPELGLLQVDGSALAIPDVLRGNLVKRHIAEAWDGGEVSPDTMASRVELQWDVCTVPEGMTGAPSVPPGRPLGVFREVFLATADSLGGRHELEGRLPGTMELSLHFPDGWARGVDKDKVALYRYNLASNRWVMVGGNVNTTGNNVTATLDEAGSFGLFVTDAAEIDKGQVLSGVTISPNPFSPNGDGLYDETNISFYLTQEATVTVEIYNVMGDGKRILAETFSYAGDDQGGGPQRVPGLIWDGRDFAGDVVPYGIYIMRVIATYNQAGGTRTIRSNHSVAVIK